MNEYQKNETNFEENMENEQKTQSTGTGDTIDLGNETDTDFDVFANYESQDAEVSESAPEVQQSEVVESVPQTEEKKEVQKTEQKQPEADVNPLAAAIAETEAKEAEEKKSGLLEKPPVFEYAGANEAISDTSITFEELRANKASDFPELEEANRVSWSVTYGKITKNVTNPKSTSIGKMKTEIEQSKDFFDSLKKYKGEVVCKVTPKVTAQKKGEASSYRGIYTTVEEATASGKPICVVPSNDGNVYEIRNNEIGEFVTKASNIRGLSKLRAGFKPALPLIPQSIIWQAVSFFRAFMNTEIETEALVNLYWDKQDKKYYLYAPKQTVSKYEVKTELADLSAERFIHVAEIHSHNTMDAKFSAIDDLDEKAARIYMVIGRLNKFLPDIAIRVAAGGNFAEVDPYSIIEGINEPYPKDWHCNVTVKNREVDIL